MTTKKFLGDASIYLVGQFLNRGVAFLLLPLYTQFLSPTDYGILSIAQTLSLIFGMLAGLSLDAATVILYYKLSKEDFRKLLFTVWLGLLTIPFMFLVVVELIGTYFGAKIFPQVPWQPYLSLAIWTAYFGIFPSLLMGLFRAKQQPVSYTIVNCAIFLLQTGLIIVFVVGYRAGAAGSLYGQAIAGLVSAIFSSILILKNACPIKWSRDSTKHLRTALVLASGYIPHVFSMWILNVSDRWILGYFVSASEIGIYSLAYTIGMLVHLVGIASISAFSPLYFKNHNKRVFRETLKKLLSGYLIIHSISALAVSLSATEILRIMTHPSFHRAAYYVPIIALGYWFFVTFYQLCLTVIENHKRTSLILYLTVPAAFLNLTLNWFLIPEYGILAASASTLAAFFLMSVLALIISGKIERLPFSWYVIFKTSCVAVVSYWFGVQFLAMDSVVFSLVAKVILVIVAGCVMFIIGGFRISDLKNILVATKI